jgi:hypothetical protein
MVWQDRLNLFWLKFLDRVWQQPGTTQTIDPTTKNTFDTATPPLRTVQVQLNCTQYFQGQWTPPSSTAFQDPAFNGSPIFIIVQGDFDSSSVFVHGSTSTEDAVEIARVHLRFAQVRYGWMDLHRQGRRWTSASKS